MVQKNRRSKKYGMSMPIPGARCKRVCITHPSNGSGNTLPPNEGSVTNAGYDRPSLDDDTGPGTRNDDLDEDSCSSRNRARDHILLPRRTPITSRLPKAESR